MPASVQLRDLGSTNGSFYGGARFDTIQVSVGANITVGKTQLGIRGPSHGVRVPPGARNFGAVIGSSDRMRQVFDVLERVAASDTTVLLEGETGTGKEMVAEAIHAASPRRDAPLIICDLGAISRGLFESELFGHVRGAFTGAEMARGGAFAEAAGGTLFLDEIGETELSAQPLLLRALENRQIKPVGASDYQTLDLRLVAATNRDLRAEVQAGHFRADLYHRLSVVHVKLPPLRERREDIPVLVNHLLAVLAEASGRPPPRVTDAMLAALTAHDWPGNVRELRNVLERAVALAPETSELSAELLGLEPSRRDDPIEPAGSVSFREAKGRLVAAWERDFLAGLLQRARGNVSEAARLGGVDRPYLHRLLKKHGLYS